MNELRAAAGKNAFPVALCGIESGGAGLWHSAFGPDDRRGGMWRVRRGDCRGHREPEARGQVSRGGRFRARGSG